MHLIGRIRKQGKWEAAVEMMVQYLSTPQSKEILVRLALAQLLLDELRRPGQALKGDGAVGPCSAQPETAGDVGQASRKSRAAREKDPSEVTVEDW